MFQFIFYVVLIPVGIILMGAYINGLIELYHEEKEDKKIIIRNGIEGYLVQTFGYGLVKIYKTIPDAEGNANYIVYLPHYEWFKSATYKWYEVYETNNGYRHMEMEGPSIY